MRLKRNGNKTHRPGSHIMILLIIVFICLFGSSSNAQDKQQTLYRVPLIEIAEKLEYQYVYDNMIYDISSKDFGDLGLLPAGENIRMTVFAAQGNKILFLPEEKINTEISLHGVNCGVHYSEKKKSYLFYTLNDWVGQEGFVPVNSPEDDFSESFRYVAAAEDVRNDEEVEGDQDLFLLKDIRKLGEIEVAFDPGKRMELPPISIEGNEYLDRLVEKIKGVLWEKNKYGTYQIYLETYGRFTRLTDGTGAKITGVVIGEGIEQYFEFHIEDAEGTIWAWYEEEKNDEILTEDAETYFVSSETLKDKPADLIPRVIGLGREVIPLEVTAETTAETVKWDAVERAKGYEWVNDSNDIVFKQMSTKEAASWIEYACSYSEWFGMNELGYQYGEVSKLDQKQVVMYVNGGYPNNKLYFIPKEKINSMIIGTNGDKLPVYVNQEGFIEVYFIAENQTAARKKHLPVTLISVDTFSDYSADYFEKIGVERLDIQALPDLSVSKIAKDKYIRSLEKHVKDTLAQEGKSGTYKMYIGEYESFGQNRVGISAAVVGEEEYYFRYMITKSHEDHYYFWPTGFGLNGSLGECEGKRHYMNRICIERTKQLNRCEIEIVI